MSVEPLGLNMNLFKKFTFSGWGGRRNQIKRFNKLIIYLGKKYLYTFVKEAKFYYLSFLLKIDRVSIVNNEEGGYKKRELKII